ncbi:MAG: AsmA-like C-terminal region-containing protein, partial [Chitinophagales bacterium]
SLLFNVRDILRGIYLIKKIGVKNADVTLLKDEKGNINYKFWKDSEEEESSEVEISLQEVSCENVAFIYTDKKNKQNIYLQAHQVKMSGNFSAENYTLKAEGNILSRFIEIGNTRYFVERETESAIEILVNSATDTYTFRDAKIKIEDTQFGIQGSITNAKELAFELAVESQEADIEALMLLLPGQYSSKLKNVESKGDVSFQSTINGVYSKQKKPLVNIDFTIEDGAIYHNSFGDKLTDVNCKGFFTNGEKQNAQTSSLVIKQLTAKYGKEPLNFDLLYKNFTNPYIDLRLNGNIPAPILLASMNENITDADGYISFNDVAITGNVRSLNTNAVKGNFSFHEVSCTIKRETITINNGLAKLENAEIVLQDFKAKIFGTDLQASLTLNNWLQIVFPSSLEVKPPLYISGNIQCSLLELDKLIETFSSETKLQQVSINSTPTRTDWMHVSGSLKCKVDEFQYNNLKIRNVNADIKLSPGFIGMKNFTGNSMHGDFNVQTTFRRLANENYLLEVIGILNAIDMQQLFLSFGNFNQTTLTDKNLKGKATAYIENISLQWDKNYKLLANSIYSLVNIKIEKGELNNYKPLESLSKFVNINDLQNISFATMQNQIEIKDSRIIIPAMQVRSSALDLDLSGTHTFSNMIDYQVELSLTKLLANKFFGKNKNKEDYEQNEKGGIKIYVSMTGSVEKPIIKYNKKEAKQKMEEVGIDKPDFLDIFKPDAEVPQQKNDLFKKQDRKEPVYEDPDTLEFIEWEDE